MVGYANGFDGCPTKFIRLVEDILWAFNNAFMVVYFDDILIVNQLWEVNLPHIR